MIAFVEETEVLGFTESVEWLAARARVEVEYEEASPRAEEGRRRRDRLLSVLDAAAATI